MGLEIVARESGLIGHTTVPLHDCIDQVHLAGDLDIMDPCSHTCRQVVLGVDRVRSDCKMSAQQSAELRAEEYRGTRRVRSYHRVSSPQPSRNRISGT